MSEEIIEMKVITKADGTVEAVAINIQEEKNSERKQPNLDELTKGLNFPRQSLNRIVDEKIYIKDYSLKNLKMDSLNELYNSINKKGNLVDLYAQ